MILSGQNQGQEIIKNLKLFQNKKKSVEEFHAFPFINLKQTSDILPKPENASGSCYAG
jgi:hypothetical protein